MSLLSSFLKPRLGVCSQRRCPHWQNPRCAFPEFVHEFFVSKYGLKKLADKHFRDMIFGVRKHSDPDDVENYDSRIALFGNISGILNMAAFSERACDVALDILKPLVSSLTPLLL